MTSLLEHGSSISRLRWETISGALALAMVVVPTVVVSQSAQTSTETRAQAPILSVLYSFKGGADGAYPQAGLVLDSAGNLYGTTTRGGSRNCSNGCGTIFKLDTTGKESLLYSFTGTGGDGAYPYSSLVRDAAGNLYGTTAGGGNSGCGGFGCGVVFKLDKTGKESVLYAFSGGTDGANPYSALVQDAAGNLYGTTFYGGASGAGVVFRLDPSAKESVLYTFTGGADGANPYSALVREAKGNLYGTTVDGGASSCTIPYTSCGVVFELDTTGKESVLYTFSGGVDGANPYSALVRDAAGNLYGTTYLGGNLNCSSPVRRDIPQYPGCGVVFKLDKTGKEVVLHSFRGADGQHPLAGLVRDTTGNLYGTAYNGASGYGTVFKLDKDGKETVLHRFAGYPTDGTRPYAVLVQDQADNLYGTTELGGASDAGVVFKIAP